jgi:hypothetical protein
LPVRFRSEAKVLKVRQLLACLALVVSCSAEPETGDNHAGGSAAASAPAVGTRRSSGLTGLYESGGPQAVNQLCIVDDGFGIVIWGAALASCSGSGRIERDGDRLRLTMTGDSPCVLEARIRGTTIALPEEAPASCSYYCGARARLAGTQLRRVDASRADALKARDLVGEPLCGDFDGEGE